MSGNEKEDNEGTEGRHGHGQYGHGKGHAAVRSCHYSQAVESVTVLQLDLSSVRLYAQENWVG